MNSNSKDSLKDWDFKPIVNPISDQIIDPAPVDHKVYQVSPTTALDTQVGGDHYKHVPIQPVEYCQKNRLNHCESSIVKYATRHQDKNGAEDIKKIIHYAKFILEFDYGITDYEGE